MSSSYDKIKRTGWGAANLPFMGKHITFDEDGNYPPGTAEALFAENHELRNRNRFLEDAMWRGCCEEEAMPFSMENYVYC